MLKWIFGDFDFLPRFSIQASTEGLLFFHHEYGCRHGRKPPGLKFTLEDLSYLNFMCFVNFVFSIGKVHLMLYASQEHIFKRTLHRSSSIIEKGGKVITSNRMD